MSSPQICYCFGYNRDDIVQDVRRNGKSLILEKITAAKKDGQCNCAQTNPKGH